MKLIFETEEDLIKYQDRLQIYMESYLYERVNGDTSNDDLLHECYRLLCLWGKHNFKGYATERFIEWFDSYQYINNNERANARKIALSKLTQEEKDILGLV